MSNDAFTSRPISEMIPGRHNECSAIGSASAPIVYFEDVPASGVHTGMVRVTLMASRDMPTPGGNCVLDHVVVAHLRMTPDGALKLKNALEWALKRHEPVPAEQVN